MGKYKIEVGGFVTVYRCRKLVVSANTLDEAEKKAINKFVEVQQKNGYSMCEDGTVESVECLN